MASKADQKKAQALLDAAGKHFLEAKTEQERRQWAETHLPMLDEAISLDPNK